jgi:predicted metal-dependent enzyme (double-stranded beta helix superfamily)
VAPTAGAALTPAGEELWEPGQVTVCCTTDDDVHAVAAVGNEPTVGIHVYGGNIGTIRRRSYDPATGEARWFVSGWDSPEGGTPQLRSNL